MSYANVLHHRNTGFGNSNNIPSMSYKNNYKSNIKNTKKNNNSNCLHSFSSFQFKKTLDNYISSRLSKHKSFQKILKSPCKSISIDQQQNNLVLSGTAEGSICIHDMSQEKSCQFQASGLLKRNKGHAYSVTKINWYPFDNGMFTSSSLDCTLKVWDSEMLQAVCEFKFDEAVPWHEMSSVVSSSNSLIAAPSGKKIYLCDLNSGSNTHTLTGHSKNVGIVKWSISNGNHLYSTGQDGSINVWDVRKATACLATTPISCSPKVGLVLASNTLDLISISNTEIVQWELPDGIPIIKRTTTLTPSLNYKRSIDPILTPSNTNEPLLILPESNRVHMMIVGHDFKVVNHFSSHYNGVNCVALLARTQEILSGGNDGEILLHTHMNSMKPDDYDDKYDDWSD